MYRTEKCLLIHCHNFSGNRKLFPSKFLKKDRPHIKVFTEIKIHTVKKNKTKQWGKNVFSINGVWKTVFPLAEERNCFARRNHCAIYQKLTQHYKSTILQ